MQNGKSSARRRATATRKLFPTSATSCCVRAPTRRFNFVKLISWNVNGLRSVLRKNFLEFLDSEKPDVLCLQEIKCTANDVEQLWPRHYTTYWNCAEKRGYSGTAIFIKTRPVGVTPHIGV